MFKLSYISAAALVLMLIFTTCGTKTSGSSDSDSTVKVAVEEEEVLEEFSSPDLGLWHLTGPVSGAVFLSYELKDTLSQPDLTLSAGMDSITFNREGLVTSMVSGSRLKGKTTIDSDLRFTYKADGSFLSGTEATSHDKLTVKLSRTSGGYLQVLQVLGPDGELSATDCYYRLIEWVGGTLFSNDIEDTEGTIRSSYTNNADGLPDKVVTKISDMGGETSIEEQYTYLKYDKYGNWIKRRVLELTNITEGEADGTNMKTTHHSQWRLDRREIYYYPPRATSPSADSQP